MIIYGDSLLKANYSGMARFHESENADLTILYHRPHFESFLYEYHDCNRQFPHLGTRTNYGVMDLDAGSQKLRRYKEKPLLRSIGGLFRNPVANATVYIIGRKAWQLVPKQGSSDVVSQDGLFVRAIQRKLGCFGFGISDGYRLDGV